MSTATAVEDRRAVRASHPLDTRTNVDRRTGRDDPRRLRAKATVGPRKLSAIRRGPLQARELQEPRGAAGAHLRRSRPDQGTSAAGLACGRNCSPVAFVWASSACKDYARHRGKVQAQVQGRPVVRCDARDSPRSRPQRDEYANGEMDLLVFCRLEPLLKFPFVNEHTLLGQLIDSRQCVSGSAFYQGLLDLQTGV